MDLQRLSRRHALQTLGCGFGSLALAGLAAQDAARASAANDPLAPKKPHHPPRAKRIIFLFMAGGVSHVDSFDYKPRLTQDGFPPARAIRFVVVGSFSGDVQAYR
jgi:hypothetical protein